MALPQETSLSTVEWAAAEKFHEQRASLAA